MVVAPALSGLFGLDWDALHHTLRLAPNLPAAWDTAHLHNVPLGDSRIDLDFTRMGGQLIVRARPAPADVCMVPQTAPRDRGCDASGEGARELSLPLPEVEVGVPGELPLPGARTAQLKAVGERRDAHRYELELEAPGGSEVRLAVRLNRNGVKVSGAELAGTTMRVRFPAGDGYQRMSVVFTW